MRRKIEITTGAYPEPVETFAMWDEGESHLSVKWSEKHEDDQSLYELLFDKKTGCASIKRTGEIRSEMVFDTSKKTVSRFFTPYGIIEMTIKTEYIKIPSILENLFEISYEIEGGADELQKNVFTMRLI